MPKFKTKFKILTISFFLLLGFFGLAASSEAANHYVRAGATGNGTDWTNALAQLPATLTRGDTYYIADGSYANYNFNTAESGTQYIYIKKATIQDHGTATGWQDSYGDGTANFTSTSSTQLHFMTGYWVFDGITGSGENVSSYGFKTTPQNCNQANKGMELPGTGVDVDVSHITISHVAAIVCGSDYDYAQISIDSKPITKRGQYITISNNYLQGGNVGLRIINNNDTIIENNFFGANWSSASNHGGQLVGNAAGGHNYDIIVRNNIFKNSVAYVVDLHKTLNERWQIYNNIVIGGVLAGVWANADSGTADVVKNIYVYHNTHIGVTIGGVGAVFVGTLTGDVEQDRSYAYNNLFYNCSNPYFPTEGYTSGAIIHTHNAHFNSSGIYDADEGGTAQVGTGDPFVDSSNGDYHLKLGALAIDTGKTLLASFDIDYAGVSRPQGSAWDIGAYEYVSGGDTTPPAAPSGLSVN